MYLCVCLCLYVCVYISLVSQFLAHLSGRTFLIPFCLSCVRPTVCLSVNFHIFIFFSRTTGAISTKLGTKHLWVMGILICTNEGQHPFPRGDNSKNIKITSILKTLKSFSEPLGQFQPNLAQSMLG